MRGRARRSGGHRRQRASPERHRCQAGSRSSTCPGPVTVIVDYAHTPDGLRDGDCKRAATGRRQACRRRVRLRGGSRPGETTRDGRGRQCAGRLGGGHVGQSERRAARRHHRADPRRYPRQVPDSRRAGPGRRARARDRHGRARRRRARSRQGSRALHRGEREALPVRRPNRGSFRCCAIARSPEESMCTRARGDQPHVVRGPRARRGSPRDTGPHRLSDQEAVRSADPRGRPGHPSGEGRDADHGRPRHARGARRRLPGRARRNWCTFHACGISRDPRHRRDRADRIGRRLHKGHRTAFTRASTSGPNSAPNWWSPSGSLWLRSTGRGPTRRCRSRVTTRSA